jgi:opacity protein-like surface antigen
MKMYFWRVCCAVLLSAGCASISHAQSQSNATEQGWGFIVDALYQIGDDIDFDGGSSISTGDDLGFSVGFGYRFNRRWEIQAGLDWQSINYDAVVIADPGLDFTARGDLDSISPHINATFNFLQGNLVPYVSAGVGWSWTDTNIPDAPPYTACWWDPWWGYYCGTFQSTRSVDDFLYQAGLGLRWDFSPGMSVRLGYNKRWLDIGKATSTPGLDQIRLSLLVYEH